MPKKDLSDLAGALEKARVQLKQGKPKMTYQYNLTPELVFVSKKIKQEYAGKIEIGIDKANKVIETQLTKALNDAMEAPVWKWTPGVTTDRKNGSSVESPRDIIDTGALQASFRINVKKGTVDFAYREPYSRMVHYGGYIIPFGKEGAQKVYLPPRPWITSVLYGENGFQAFPFRDIWLRAIKDEFRR
jgi:hypothetical protein